MMMSDMMPNQEQQQGPKGDGIDNAYTAWSARRSPSTLTPLISSLQPTINSSLRTYGFANDPNMLATAQLHVIKSLDRYDPEKAGVKTFVTNELRRIQRLGPQQRFALPMPVAITISVLSPLTRRDALVAVAVCCTVPSEFPNSPKTTYLPGSRLS